MKAEESSTVSILYAHLIHAAIQTGKQIYSIDVESERCIDDIDQAIEIESQIAEILYDLGLVVGAQYLYRDNNDGDDSIVVKLNATLRSRAILHFKQSILVRKRLLKEYESINQICEEDSMNYEKKFDRHH